MSELTAGLDYKAEYARLNNELYKAKQDISCLEEINASYERVIRESNTIKQTLYVVFGRSFYDE